MTDYPGEMADRETSEYGEIRVCDYCDEEFICAVPGSTERRFDYCSDGCYENACERAYQRSLEEYYGGSSPQTVQEQYIAAWHEKRRLH